MREDISISFFDCCDVSQESTITIRETEQTAYTFVEKAARRIAGWITVTAECLCRIVFRTIRTWFRKTYLNSGVQVLRQSSILII